MLPRWTGEQEPDHAHPHRRRFTPAYRRKQALVKNVWIVSGLIMLLNGSPAGILSIALATTFLSFLILDETG